MVENNLNKDIKVCDRCNGKNYLIECTCGCGQLRFLYSKKGKLRRFINHHHKRGKFHHNYKNGVMTDKKGYKYTRDWNHPYHGTLGYVATHRLIYEHYLKILFDEDVYIPKQYEIHHIKPISKTQCDNSLINLELLTHHEHRIRHKMKDMSGRICFKCGSDKTGIKPGIKRPNWYGNEVSGWICSKCYLKEYKRKR